MTEKAHKQTLLYRFGAFEVDAKEGILRKDGRVVPLSAKIFDTLLYLVQNNGRLLMKNELMENIWADSFVEEANLTTNISLLRKILHETGDQYIETYPKRGYRFRADVESVSSESEMLLTRRVTTVVRRTVEETGPEDEVQRYKLLLSGAPNNLAPPQNAIIGRENEIAGIRDLIMSNRLVTLTGVGGTGKTRLAQEVAIRLLSEFEHGAFFVALETIRNTELIIPAFAQVLGIKESKTRPLAETLGVFLQEKSILLIADNFEQIVSAAPILEEILRAAPSVSMLVTSRIPLDIKIGREFRVPTLSLPPVSGPFMTQELDGFESFRLFAERAREANSEFIIGERNSTDIAEICRQLDGLPLAIELAAARVKILSPAQILTRLKDRLKLLTGGSKDRPLRQQTMRGAIDWSYDLLDEDEKRLFRRLSVFSGGFTIEALEAICPEDDLDILNCLTSLVENSLVARADTGSGDPRFRLLEVVREYALEVLETSGEREMMADRHAAFFVSLAEEGEGQFFGETGTYWLDRLEAEHDNLRAVLAQAAENNPEVVVRLAGAIRTFWVLHNHLVEGRKWLGIALEYSGDKHRARFKLLHGLGQMAMYAGEIENAKDLHAQGLAAARIGGDTRQLGLSLRALAGAAKQGGEVSRARELNEEALKIGRESGDTFGIAVSLNALGDLARLEDDFTAALVLFGEAFDLSTKLGNKEGICGTKNNLGAAEYGLGNYGAARAHYTTALRVAREIGDKITISYSLDGFAAILLKEGDAIGSAHLAGAAEYLRESLGFEMEPAERRFRAAYLTEFNQDNFAEEYRRGRNMRIEEAIELALNDK
jgi:predicted ATPase/DNA-binding winged helix-turn-helix (wHTH) protein